MITVRAEIETETDVDISLKEIKTALEEADKETKKEILNALSTDKEYCNNAYDKMRNDLINKIVDKYNKKSIDELEEILSEL